MNRNAEPGDLEGDLQAALRAIHKDKGECPNAESLEQFTSGVLDGEERERVRRHIQSCGVCDHLMSRIQEFDSATTGWQEPPHRFFDQSLLRFALHPAFSYSLVAVLGAVLFAVRQEPPSHPEQAPPAIQPSLPVPVEAAAAVDLNAFRSSDKPIELRLPPAGRRFALSFAVPVRSGFQYRAHIAGPLGAPGLPEVQLTDFDALGNTAVVCRRDDFVPGQYTVKVTESDVRGRVTERRLVFSFFALEKSVDRPKSQ